jgi:REP element-mobilizing transposase RayT
MPNHFHAILLIQDSVGAKQDLPALPAFDLRGTRAKHENTVLSPLRGTIPGSICSIIQNFKSVTTRKINQIRVNPGCPVWQRNYYERVIRNEHELDRAREYIVNNPLKWELDKENPVNRLTNTNT